MGEAKRRQRLDPNFGLVPKKMPVMNVLSSMNVSYCSEADDLESEELGLPKINEGIDCYYNQEIVKTLADLLSKKGSSLEKALETVPDWSNIEIYSPKYYLALEKSQGLFILWFELANFALSLNCATAKTAISFWEAYSLRAITLLGQARLNDVRLFPWFRRLRGISLFVIEGHYRSFPELARLKLASVMEQKKEFFSLWDTTLEIGLAFANNNVIYAGQALMVWKGRDGVKERGELMIAVKHSSGCWNHYPSSQNLSVPFSDYKQAKLALEKFPLSLRGELYHQRSNKLARLLGLTVKNNYAHLVK